MAFLITALGLAALTSASPLPTVSDGFKLQIQVTDRSQDFTPSIYNKFVVGTHIGAGMNMATPAIKDEYDVFHTNGTDADLWAARGTIVSGFGQYAQGWNNVRNPDDANLSASILQYGPGTEGVRVLEEPGNPVLGPGQYMVCDRKLPYGLSVELTTEGVPEPCVAVTLVPICADLGVDAKQAQDQTVSQTLCKKLN